MWCWGNIVPDLEAPIASNTFQFLVWRQSKLVFWSNNNCIMLYYFHPNNAGRIQMSFLLSDFTLSGESISAALCPDRILLTSDALWWRGRPWGDGVSEGGRGCPRGVSGGDGPPHVDLDPTAAHGRRLTKKRHRNGRKMLDWWIFIHTGVLSTPSTLTWRWLKVITDIKQAGIRSLPRTKEPPRQTGKSSFGNGRVFGLSLRPSLRSHELNMSGTPGGNFWKQTTTRG